MKVRSIHMHHRLPTAVVGTALVVLLTLVAAGRANGAGNPTTDAAVTAPPGQLTPHSANGTARRDNSTAPPGQSTHLNGMPVAVPNARPVAGAASMPATSNSAAPGVTGQSASGGTAGEKAPSGSRLVVDDSIITTKVKDALLADPSVKGSEISVETRKGEVLLTGFVSNQPEIERAIKVARGVDGVKMVSNKMTVKR